MEATWPRASQFIIFAEGGLVEDPTDPGGLTNFGISRRAYPDLDIRNLTVDGALDIYHRDYWLKASCDKLPYPLDLLVFDTAVNEGIAESITTLQRAAGITVDGEYGPDTQQAAANMAQQPRAAAVVFLSYREAFYAQLGVTHPQEAATDERGWLLRCLRLLRFILTNELE